jgi:predicted adenylyl cyclase CyaB
MKLCELEIKIQLDSQAHFHETLGLCQDIYGPMASQIRQLDEYWDTLDGQLRKQNLLIRVRTVNGCQTIALKSPRVQLPSGMHHRIELEFATLQGPQVVDQLKNQNLCIVQASEKERWTFVQDDLEIAVDRLPFLGCFVEVEGPNEAAIKEVLKTLELDTKPATTKHYSELMTDYFKALQLPTTYIQATFAAEEQWNIANATL